MKQLNIILLAVFLGAFFFGVAIHVIVWRIRRPKDDAAALFRLVVLLPLLGSGLGAFALLDVRGLQLLDAFLLGAIFHFGAGFTYMSLYTASQAASPTSLILMRLASAGAAGISEVELCEQFTSQQLSGDSVQSAVDERFLSAAADGTLVLAPRGRTMLSVCTLLRQFLGLGQGKG